MLKFPIHYSLLDTGVPTEVSSFYPIENVPLAVFGVPDVAGRDPHVLCARREDFLQEGLHQVSKNYEAPTIHSQSQLQY